MPASLVTAWRAGRPVRGAGQRCDQAIPSHRNPIIWRLVRSGFCLFGRLLSGLGLRRNSHGPGITVCGVISGNLQPLGGGGSLQHSILRDLFISFLGLFILRLGSETDVSVAPTFSSGHKTLILLL